MSTITTVIRPPHKPSPARSEHQLQHILCRLSFAVPTLAFLKQHRVLIERPSRVSALYSTRTMLAYDCIDLAMSRANQWSCCATHTILRIQATQYLPTNVSFQQKRVDCDIQPVGVGAHPSGITHLIVHPTQPFKNSPAWPLPCSNLFHY